MFLILRGVRCGNHFTHKDPPNLSFFCVCNFCCCCAILSFCRMQHCRRSRPTQLSQQSSCKQPHGTQRNGGDRDRTHCILPRATHQGIQMQQGFATGTALFSVKTRAEDTHRDPEVARGSRLAGHLGLLDTLGYLCRNTRGLFV